MGSGWWRRTIIKEEQDGVRWMGSRDVAGSVEEEKRRQELERLEGGSKEEERGDGGGDRGSAV